MHIRFGDTSGSGSDGSSSFVTLGFVLVGSAGGDFATLDSVSVGVGGGGGHGLADDCCSVTLGSVLVGGGSSGEFCSNNLGAVSGGNAGEGVSAAGDYCSQSFGAGWYQCAGGGCLYGGRCDGFNNCGDWSDEQNCKIYQQYYL